PMIFRLLSRDKTLSLSGESMHAVAGRELPLKIVENARATRLTLRIEPGGKGLRITVPLGLRRGEIERFLARNEEWLEQKLAKLPLRPQVRPGIKLPIRGKPHRIVHESGRRGTVVVESRPEGPVIIVCGDRRHLPRRLADFLKREAKKDIERLVDKH